MALEKLGGLGFWAVLGWAGGWVGVTLKLYLVDLYKIRGRQPTWLRARRGTNVIVHKCFIRGLFWLGDAGLSSGGINFTGVQLHKDSFSKRRR
jgi:hypothetical protein